MIPSWETRLADILRERGAGSPSASQYHQQQQAQQLMSPGRRSSPTAPSPPGAGLFGSFDDNGPPLAVPRNQTTPKRSISPCGFGAPGSSIDFLRASTVRNLRMSEAANTISRSSTPRITPITGLYVVGADGQQQQTQQQIGRPPTPPRSSYDGGPGSPHSPDGLHAAALARRNAELADELRLVKGQLEHRQAECSALQREIVSVRAEIAAQANIAVDKIREAEQQWCRERESLQTQLRYQTEQVHILSGTIQQLLQAKQQQPANFQLAQNQFSRSPSGQPPLGY
jgi:hypothetical protein